VDFKAHHMLHHDTCINAAFPDQSNTHTKSQSAITTIKICTKTNAILIHNASKCTIFDLRAIAEGRIKSYFKILNVNHTKHDTIWQI